jgi:hypothetical protein
MAIQYNLLQLSIVCAFKVDLFGAKQGAQLKLDEETSAKQGAQKLLKLGVEAVANDVASCKAWQLKHRVKPGTSWGTLPSDLQGEWKKRACDAIVTGKGSPRLKCEQWKATHGVRIGSTWGTLSKDLIMQWKRTKCDTLILADCNKEGIDANKQRAKADDERTRILALPGPPPGKKWVISFGLYGSNPKYTTGMIKNAQLAKVIFPGWVVRVYLDDTVPQAVKDTLTSEGCELKLIADEEKRTSNLGGSIAGMFWRFMAIDEPDVDRYIVRDADSRLNYRERFAVEEWVQRRYCTPYVLHYCTHCTALTMYRSSSGESTSMVHTVRDHPSHDRPLNGGMWGAVHGFLDPSGGGTMRDLIQHWQKKTTYGAGEAHHSPPLSPPPTSPSPPPHHTPPTHLHPSTLPLTAQISTS